MATTDLWENGVLLTTVLLLSATKLPFKVEHWAYSLYYSVLNILLSVRMVTLEKYKRCILHNKTKCLPFYG